MARLGHPERQPASLVSLRVSRGSHLLSLFSSIDKIKDTVDCKVPRVKRNNIYVGNLEEIPASLRKERI